MLTPCNDAVYKWHMSNAAHLLRVYRRCREWRLGRRTMLSLSMRLGEARTSLTIGMTPAEALATPMVLDLLDAESWCRLGR